MRWAAVAARAAAAAAAAARARVVAGCAHARAHPPAPRPPAPAPRAAKSLYADLRAPNKTLPIISLLTGEPTGAVVALDERVFSTPMRPDIVHRVIQWQEKRARTTAYKGLGRSEVRGGGRKPYKQKGTGRARAGSIRSPLWVGGGVAHPPKLKEWGHHLQKRVRRLGLMCALAGKYRDLRLTVVDALDVPAAKTKLAAAALDAQGARAGKRALFVSADAPPEPFRAALRNLPGAKALAQVGANVRDIVLAERLFITPDALAALTARVKRED